MSPGFRLLSWLLLLSSLLSSSFASSKPGCENSCGSVAVPYPFGIGQGCSLSESFEISCNDSYNLSTPYLVSSGLEVLNISLDDLRLKNEVAHICYNESFRVNTTAFYTQVSINLTGTPFTFSETANRLTLIGCNSIALLIGANQSLTGCISQCNQTTDVENGSCSSRGCCQAPIPKNLQFFASLLMSPNADSETWMFSPCTYAFIVEETSYIFEASDVYGNLNSLQKFKNSPVVLDWVVGTETCEEAQRNSQSYLCHGNSTCIESAAGYRCNCKPGYEGSPYLSPGCQDINECENPNICKVKCINIPGSYQCICPRGSQDNDTHCITPDAGFPVKATIGIGFSLLFTIVTVPGLYLFIKKRKSMKLRQRFFEQNGGLLLQQQIAYQQGIFTAQELEKATANYADSRILGQGGYGTVYKGYLANNKVVAIKKSKVADKSQIEQFINEVVILTQVNHRNVVKLLGCCLETQVPLLVYEYVPNQTLYNHIHNNEGVYFVSWQNRLRIATETASALAYLHSAATTPIVHRDVKSANILLDNNYNVKVSDFGASRLIPLDSTQVNTLVQGTFGYLDPEYFQTSLLTDKSDVYSFGVLLLELLTGKKPISFERPETERNLASHFMISMQQNNLFQILEARVLREGNQEQIIAVAELAMKCLRLKGCERPAMKQVSFELDKLITVESHPWEQTSHNEIVGLLDELGPRDLYLQGASSTQGSVGISMISAITLSR